MGENDSGSNGATIGTVTDQGSGGNNATGTNGPTYSNSVPTFASTVSADLDGTNDSILISSTPTYVTQSASFSLSFWMNPEGYGSDGTYANVLALKSDFNSKNFAIHINNNTSGYAGISFGITDYSTNTAYYHTTGVTGNSLLNTWSHVVITYNGNGLGTIGNWKLYIDGDSKTIGSAGGWFNGTSVNTIGDYRSYHYDGKIDELAVFSSLLSASDVTSIYNSGVPADLTSYSPVGWWRMGENDSGSDGATIGTVTDQGSGGNNGTGTNGPTYSNSVPVPFASTLSADLDGTNEYLAVGSSYDLGTLSGWFKSDSTISAGSSSTNLVGFVGVAPYASACGISFGSIAGAVTNEIISIYTGDWVYSYAHASDTISTDWHHVAIRWTGSDYEIYLDGVQVKNHDGEYGSATAKSKIAISSFRIGQRSDGQKSFGGLIDEVAIWSTPLSASDTIALYNSGAPSNLSALSPNGWWRMGENDSGSNGSTIGTVTDQGSGGNNATQQNSPTYSNSVPS